MRVRRCAEHATGDPNEIRATTPELCFDCLSAEKANLEIEGYPRPREKLRSINRRLWEVGDPRRHG